MGVPGFFAWLLKQKSLNNKILQTSLNVQPYGLYLDANCLFHPQCFKILKLYTSENDISKLEGLMIKQIIAYIEFLIKITNPSNIIYIGVDGVAPLAKIRQQRMRRYKSVVENSIKNNIMKQHNIDFNSTWSNIVITPGTDFMIKLDKALLEFVSKLKRTYPKFIIKYSSYKEEGEGEHKILQYIKKNYGKEKYYQVIYGLDADLIFLALSTDMPNIFLLRESSQFKKTISKSPKDDSSIEEDMTFVSIDETKRLLNEYIQKRISIEYNSDTYKDSPLSKLSHINDFIFICFFLGNDFLPHILSLDIKKNGIEYILNAYIDGLIHSETNLIELIKNKDNLITDIKINPIGFERFLQFLSDSEEKFFKEDLLKHMQFYDKRRNFATTPYERDLALHENIFNLKTYDKFAFTNQNVLLSDSKHQYYEHYFKQSSNQEELIKNISKSYFEMLRWVLEYYFMDCPNWLLQYEFNHAPFISDIYKNIGLNNNNLLRSKDHLTMHEQLLSVIPPQYSHILPKIVQKNMQNINISHMFPLTSHIDTLYKEQYWAAQMELPYLDYKLIRNNIN
jgi:5'-3' exonuclease